MHFLASVFTGVALGASSLFGFFHGGPHGTSTPPFGGRPSIASSTFAGGNFHIGNMASSTVSAATITCVGSAVATREGAIDAAEINLTSALNSAYSARASALASAYALTTGSAVSAAVKAAWQAFSSATMSAQKSWRSTRLAAWQAFSTAAKACKAPPSLLDTNDQSLETSGQ